MKKEKVKIKTLFFERKKMFQPTLITDTLDPSKNEELKNLLNNTKIALCDVDYTLIDISKGHDAGVQAVSKIINNEVASRFNEIFHLIVAGHRVSESEDWEERERFEEIVEKQTKIQKNIVGQWGLKYWSKGTMILIAAEELRVTLKTKQLKQARDAYWNTRTENSHPYDYCKNFYTFLKEKSIPLDIFTSSYHILEIDDNLQFSCEPASSKKYKINSISPLLPKETRNKIIGDPIDKPAPEFFEQVYESITKGEYIVPKDICVVGDSLRNDLQYLGEKGCKTILVQHNSG